MRQVDESYILALSSSRCTDCWACTFASYMHRELTWTEWAFDFLIAHAIYPND